MKITFATALALASIGLPIAVWADDNTFTLLPLELKSTDAQSQAQGFSEGQTLTGFTRNWYSHERSARGPMWSYYKDDGRKVSTSQRNNWVQSTVIDYTSGFTPGLIGLGVEVAAYNTIALERGKASVAGPNNRTLTDSQGNVEDQWSKLGLANVKARVSNTTLTAGRQAVNTPVLAVYNNRALPSSFQGVGLISEEFSTLTFKAGTFDRVSPRTEQSQTRFRAKYASKAFAADRVIVGGIDYQPTKNLKTSAYVSSVEDFWTQYYLGAVVDWGNPQTLGFSTVFNYYNTQDAGSQALGEIDNQAYSLALTATHNAHAVTLAWQQVNGNEYFDYLHETGANYLANALFSDFNGPNEKSFRVAYSVDMAGYGIPGLKLNIYNARGWGIDGTHYQGTAYNVRALQNANHYEYGVGVSYVVQSGVLKKTALRATYANHRGSEGQIDGNVDELRIVSTFPFEF
jgi:hypothetical protein